MESFDRYAGDYDRLLDDPLRHRFASDGDFFIHQKCRVLMRQLRRDRPSARRLRLLDAGCGQGTAIAFLSKEARVIGTDVSLPMLRDAVRCGPVSVQEPFNLPFANESFDAAFAFCVYHHIDAAHHVRHLRELRRIVKAGGRVYVFEHNPFNPVTRRIFARAPIDRGCHLIAPAQLRARFREAGLDAVRSRYLLFLPERLWKRFGCIEPALAWLPLGGQYFVSGRKT
jgi:SAM-dependent methyltransferase